MAFIIILAIVGILLVVAEIFLLPGIGMTGVLGFLCLLVSCSFAFSTAGAPVGYVVTAVCAASFFSLLIYALKVKSWRRFMFRAVGGTQGLQQDGKEPVGIGDIGRTLERLSPYGQARFGDMEYRVKALEGQIPPDADVEIVLIEDNRITVKPLRPDF